MSKLKRTLLTTLALVSVAALSVAGTLAYLTDRNSAQNIFTMGDVEITLNETFEQGAELMPGYKIQKKTTITNTGENAAYVWMTLAIPAALDDATFGTTGQNNILHWNVPGCFWEGYHDDQKYINSGIAAGYLDENSTGVELAKTWNVDDRVAVQTNVDINGVLCNVYTYLYNSAIEPGETTNIALHQVYLDSHVDYNKNDGKYYWVEDGETTLIDYDLANVCLYVNAYAVQKTTIENVDAAYKAYVDQWGTALNGNYDAPVWKVATSDELAKALASGWDVALTEDIAVEENETIVIPEGTETTLDLAGYTLTNAMVGAPAIQNDGTLTITGDGAIVNGVSDTRASHTIVNNGELVIESGVIGTDATAGAAVSNYGTATINGGTFASKQEDVKSDGKCAYVFINNGGTMTINDATVDCETHGLFAAYGGDLIVNGGSYTLQGNNGLGCYVVYATADGVVTLNGGDITSITPRNKHWAYVSKNGDHFNNAAVATGNIVLNTAEPTVLNTLTTTAELATAIADGKTEHYLGKGTFTIPAAAKGKTLTINGVEGTIIEVVPAGQGEAGGQLDYNLDGSNVTFNNVTIKTNNQTYAGYARLSATYNNCTFVNQYCLNGNSEFNNCTLNVSGDVYNIWTWGASIATFNGCTFNSDGKALLLYSTVNTTLNVNNCAFNDNGGLTDLKAAIEIGNDYDKSYNLIVNDTVVNGYEINDKGINTGSTLWANKNSMSQDKLNVVINGVDVY